MLGDFVLRYRAVLVGIEPGKALRCACLELGEAETSVTIRIALGEAINALVGALLRALAILGALPCAALCPFGFIVS